MNYQSACNIIRTRFKTEIADIYSLSTQYDNDGLFNKPDDGTEYSRFNIRTVSAEQVETGSTHRYRRFGLVVVQLFFPFGIGDKDLKITEDHIISAFEGSNDSDVHFKTAYLEEVGRDGSYWQENVNLPFYFDDVK